MSTYEAMRHFADSWVLLAMTLFFLAVVWRSVTAKSEHIAAAAGIPLTEMSPADFAGDAQKQDQAQVLAEAAPNAPVEAEAESCCGDCANKGECAAAKAHTHSFGDAG